MFHIARKLSAAEPARIAGQTFPYPVSPCPPIAVFSRQFAVAPPAILVDHHRELAAAGVRTVAAALSVLHAIDPAIWRPEYPLVVLSRLNRGLITEDDRDYLWDRFRVPVFEYLLNSSGRILAEECEAHDGLHLHCDVNDLSGFITRDVCACGKSTQRLLTLDGIIEESIAVSTLKQEWRNWQTHQT